MIMWLFEKFELPSDTTCKESLQVRKIRNRKSNMQNLHNSQINAIKKRSSEKGPSGQLHEGNNFKNNKSYGIVRLAALKEREMSN